MVGSCAACMPARGRCSPPMHRVGHRHDKRASSASPCAPHAHACVEQVTIEQLMAGLEAQAQQPPAAAVAHASAEPVQAPALTQQAGGPWMKALLSDGDEGVAELAALATQSPTAAPAAAAAGARHTRLCAQEVHFLSLPSLCWCCLHAPCRLQHWASLKARLPRGGGGMGSGAVNMPAKTGNEALPVMDVPPILSLPLLRQ